MHFSRPWLLAALAAVFLATIGCSDPPAGPLPAITAVGDAITGPNPVVPGTPGARHTAISYGPWTVPAATTGTDGHHGGAMKEDVKFAIRKPCTDCYITGATPRLTYADGTTANTDTGLWLHHFVLFSSGGVDSRCGNTLAALVGEVFFTGANERTAAHSPAGTGYRVHPLDSWSLMVDLMNMNALPKDVKFEVTYDWVPASTPGMHAMKPVFMDVGEACVDSTVPAGTGQYSRKNTWTATVPGRVMGVASHMHDGGTRVVLRNLTTGTTICDSKAYYGGPGFEEPAGSDHGHDGMAMATTHLSAVDQCIAQGKDRPVAVIKRGDQLEIEAFYDADLHPHDPNDPVMGLVFMYVLPEETA
jgi:hypothetical protein